MTQPIDPPDPNAAPPVFHEQNVPDVNQWNAQEKRRKSFKIISRLSFGAAFVLAIVMFVQPVPYVVMTTGPMFNTLGSSEGVEFVSIEDTKTYPVSGSLNLMTVRERGGPYGSVSIPEIFFSWLQDSDDVIPSSALYPEGTSRQQAQERNVISFDSAQSNAVAASMNNLGEPVTATTFIVGVVSESPAQGVLEVGDVVVSIDGTKIESPEQVVKVIQARKPGDKVEVKYERDGKALSDTFTLIASPADPKKGFLGVRSATSFEGPFPIEFGVEGVGGPSAGLVFSLSIIDKLTPDDLTGGKNVSVTGTISPEGKVGAIGGLKQKLAAAQNDGSELFLVPEGNCDVVLANPTSSMPVVPVENLDQALDALKAFRSGSGALPQCK